MKKWDLFQVCNIDSIFENQCSLPHKKGQIPHDHNELIQREHLTTNYLSCLKTLSKFGIYKIST